MVGSLAGRIHGENRGTAANVEDNLVLEEVGVLVDRIAVASCADLIFLTLLSAFVLPLLVVQTRVVLPAFPRGCLRVRISNVHTVFKARRRTMVVVAVHSKSANVSSFASLVISVPVEVMRLSVGQGADTLLASCRGSVMGHVYELKSERSERERRVKELESSAFTAAGAGKDNL